MNLENKIEISCIEELIQMRKHCYQTNEANKMHFEDILIGLYKHPSHFIYEILQNAEDACASKVEFILRPEYLDITYDGKPFDLDDVDAITIIGNSTKEENTNQIGKFGVGFKSVFAITTSPIIESGDYHFKITNFIVPAQIGESNRKDNVRIRLPFNHPHADRNPEAVYSLIKNKLKELEPSSILFLSNIKEIEWTTDSENGKYTKKIGIESIGKELPITEIQYVDNEILVSDYFIKFDRLIDPELCNKTISIAFKLENDEDGRFKIVKAFESNLHVYFPTSLNTQLSFIVHGPFHTVVSREDVPLDHPDNTFLIEKLSLLIEESLLIMNENRLSNLDLLNTLPIDKTKNTNPIAKTLYDTVKSVLSTKRGYIPTDDDVSVLAGNMAIAQQTDIPDLFDSDMAQSMIQKEAWVSREITSSKYKAVREYLIEELDIQFISMSDLLSKFTPELIDRMNDKWLVSFYISISDQPALWKASSYGEDAGILRTIPFIRLSNNEISQPFDGEGNPIVYLPRGDRTEYKTIKSNLVLDPTVKTFFEKMGLSEPDINAEIREFILPLYKSESNDISTIEYHHHINLILSALNGSDESEVTSLISLIKKSRIIPVKYEQSDELVYKLPRETYVPTNDLVTYFEKSPGINLICAEVFNGYEPQIIEMFFKRIGCQFTPIRISISKAELSKEFKSAVEKRINASYTWSEKITDYTLDRLPEALEEISQQRSIAIWNMLLRILSTQSSYWKSSILKGKYKFGYRNPKWRGERDRTEYFDSVLLLLLQEKDWLYTKSGKCVNPTTITMEDLIPDYQVSGEDAITLVELLKFQITDAKLLAEKTGKRVILMDDDQWEEWLNYKSAKKERLSSSEPIKDEDLTESWNPEVSADKVEVSIIQGRAFPQEDPVNPVKPSEAIEHIPSVDTFNSNIQEGYVQKRMSKKDRDLEGLWGEQLLFNHLRQKYNIDKIGTKIEVRWLNLNGNIGRGYDFEILKNGEIIEVIEVKATKSLTSGIIELSRTQWEYAKSLHVEGKGNLYTVAVVFGAGTMEAKLAFFNDPLNSWFRGELVTQAIQLKVST